MSGSNGYKSPRILLSMMPELLEKVDQLAAKNFTNRSIIIRWAITEYLNNHPLSVSSEQAEVDRIAAEAGEHPDDIKFKRFMAAIQELES